MNNYLKSVVFLFVIAILFSNCTSRLQPIGASSEVTLIPSKHIDTPVRIRPGEMPWEYRSFLYRIKSDTFRITVIDHNRNGRFNDKEDLFVISSTETFVPFFSFLNPNVTKYTPGMMVLFKDHAIEVEHIADNGEKVRLKRMNDLKRIASVPSATYIETIDTDYYLENVYTTEVRSIQDILNENPQKLVYFHFWWTACAPCFTAIPFLQKLEQEGVLVINIARKEMETHEDLLKTIAKFEYPGLHFYATPEVVRDFSQNGFPFGTLIESNSGKKLIENMHAYHMYEEIHKQGLF